MAIKIHTQGATKITVMLSTKRKAKRHDEIRVPERISAMLSARKEMRLKNRQRSASLEHFQEYCSRFGRARPPGGPCAAGSRTSGSGNVPFIGRCGILPRRKKMRGWSAAGSPISQNVPPGGRAMDVATYFLHLLECGRRHGGSHCRGGDKKGVAIVLMLFPEPATTTVGTCLLFCP